MFSKLYLLFLGILFTFSISSLAATSSDCPGESGYWFTNYKHRNPTQGGFISDEADVQDTDDLIFIGPKVSICGSSRVVDRARIYGHAIIRNARVSGNAEISGNALIEKGADVTDEAKIQGEAIIRGSVKVSGKAVIAESALLENSNIENMVEVKGSAYVGGESFISENASVNGSARVSGHAMLTGTVKVDGTAQIKGFTIRKAGFIENGLLDEPDFAAIEQKRLDDIEQARQKILKEETDLANAEMDRKNKENLLQQKLAEHEQEQKAKEKEILDLAAKVHLNLQFLKNKCAMRILDKTNKVFNFDFTKYSNSPARYSGQTGIQVERSGEDYSLVMETEVQNGEWQYLHFFNVNNSDFAEKFKETMESYFSKCR